MKAYIWDLDGTLLDSYKVIVDSLFDTYKEYGLVLDKDEIHKHVITYSVTSFIEHMTAQTGVSFDVMKTRYSEISEEKKKNITLIPHAAETLSMLKENGATNYVYTHRGKSTQSVLDRLGLACYFEEVLTSQSGFARKPEPDAIDYLVEKYGLDKDATFYVGDRIIDMDCAKNAKVKGILFLPEQSYCVANGSEDYIVNDLLKILNIHNSR